MRRTTPSTCPSSSWRGSDRGRGGTFPRTEVSTYVGQGRPHERGHHPSSLPDSTPGHRWRRDSVVPGSLWWWDSWENWTPPIQTTRGRTELRFLWTKDLFRTIGLSSLRPGWRPGLSSEDYPNGSTERKSCGSVKDGRWSSSINGGPLKWVNKSVTKGVAYKWLMKEFYPYQERKIFKSKVTSLISIWYLFINIVFYYLE